MRRALRPCMIPTDKIRDLIGKGGATIRGIIEQTGAKIDVDDTGRVSVASSDAEGLKKALEMIGNITAVPEIGKVYLGKVVRLAEFGAFVELFPGTDGLLHISEIAEHRVKEVKDELREGDQVMVKVLAIEGNRIKLSRKALIKEQKAKLAQSAPAEAEEAEIAAPAAPRQRRRPCTASPRVRRASAEFEPEHHPDRRRRRLRRGRRRGVRRRERAELQPRGWRAGSRRASQSARRPSASQQQQSPASPAPARWAWWRRGPGGGQG